MTAPEIVAFALLALAGVAFLIGRVARAREAKLPRVPVDQARAEVLSIAARGESRDRTRAIKALRDRTGLGLREAHDTVTWWLSEKGSTDKSCHQP